MKRNEDYDNKTINSNNDKNQNENQRKYHNNAKY